MKISLRRNFFLIRNRWKRRLCVFFPGFEFRLRRLKAPLKIFWRRSIWPRWHFCPCSLLMRTWKCHYWYVWLLWPITFICNCSHLGLQMTNYQHRILFFKIFTALLRLKMVILSLKNKKDFFSSYLAYQLGPSFFCFKKTIRLSFYSIRVD